jgi:hypothetical protein
MYSAWIKLDDSLPRIELEDIFQQRLKHKRQYKKYKAKPN